MKKNNIGVLITIILLLCICLPGAIYGTYMHYKLEALGGNANKDFYHEGKLYFYDNDILLGTYTCETTKCDYANNSIDNQEFENFNTEETPIELINKQYAFIQDGKKIVLYDVSRESAIIDYKEVKNYSVGIDSDYYLVKNISDQWGMIKVANNINVVIPNNYKYLGLLGNMSGNNQIDASKIIAQTENDWKLLNLQNNVIVSTNEMIVDYSDQFIVTNDGKNHIYNYGGTEILATYNISSVQLLENIAIAFVENNNSYFVYSSKNQNLIGTIPITTFEEINFTIENDMLVARADDKIIKTIALD